MRSRRPTVLTALAVGTVLLAGGCSPDPAGPSAADSPPAATPVPTPTPGVGTGGSPAMADVPVRPAQDQAPAAPPAPVSVAVPGLGLEVPVVPEGVDDQGRMGIPDDARSAGWYQFGSAPSSEAGTTVVAAHVDDPSGAGPFARLRDAEPGDVVTVVDETGDTYTYTVTDVQSIPKADLPADDLFERDGAPRLVLVTCGGRWDPEQVSYTDNLLVTARPVS